jgi:hypothetical protein
MQEGALVRGFIDGEYQDGELRGCTFVAGVRGMGKTTEMARLLNGCLGGSIFFDPLSRHQDALPGWRLITQPGELELYLRANKGRRFRVLYQPQSGDLDAHFRAVCTIVRAFGWLIFGMDELDMMCGPRWGDSRMPPELYHLVNYGRHCRVSMLATARRPMNVARGYTSQCQTMRLFYMRERADVRYFEEYIGQEDARRLASLPRYHYLLWTGSADPAQAFCGEKRV